MPIPACLILICCSCTLAASDYFVAPPPTGNDGNNGLSSGAPLATIAAALAKASSGDHVLLQRDGVFRGTFTLPAGLTLDAYGSGALPVVTASTLVTPSGGTIKTASVPSQVKALWIDRVFAPLARYPDTGWLTCDTGSTASVLTDGALAGRGAGRSTGAQVRWRRWSWWWETRPITGDDGAGHLTLSGTAEVDAGLVGIGSGYFIDNDLQELNQDREWFWGTGVLSVQVPAGATTVEVVTTDNGISAAGGTIQNISFQRFSGTALTLNGPTTVRGCEFRELDTNAIDGTWNAFGSLITGNTFRDVRNCGVAWIENPGASGGTIIERNQFERIGMQLGYGGSGAWHASGVVLNVSKATTVRLNRFIDIGYCGVIMGTDGQNISRNVFVRCLSTLNDGGAVYANCSLSNISENIVLDSIGALDTSHPWTPLGQGIWVEFLDQFHDSQIVNNTIYGCNGNGIFLSNNYHCTITGNTCVDNRLGGLYVDRGDDSRPGNMDHTITGNILGVVASTRRLARTENLAVWADTITRAFGYETGVDYGTMSGTTFVVPGGQRLVRTSDGVDQTLAQWQAANPSWAESGSATKLVAEHPILLFNDTETAANIAVPAGTWKRLDGSVVGATVSVAPFRSVVLTGATAPTSPPYYAASGTDYRSDVSIPVVPVAPAITADPVNTTVTAPNPSGMSVVASGTSPMTYVWQRQGAGGGGWTTVAGASGPQLNVATSVADDGAGYRCQVSNAAGSVTSAAAVLTVQAAPPGGGGGGSSSGGGGGGCGLGGGLASLLLFAASLVLGLRTRSVPERH